MNATLGRSRYDGSRCSGVRGQSVELGVDPTIEKMEWRLDDDVELREPIG